MNSLAYIRMTIEAYDRTFGKGAARREAIQLAMTSVAFVGLLVVFAAASGVA